MMKPYKFTKKAGLVIAMSGMLIACATFPLKWYWNHQEERLNFYKNFKIKRNIDPVRPAAPSVVAQFVATHIPESATKEQVHKFLQLRGILHDDVSDLYGHPYCEVCQCKDQWKKIDERMIGSCLIAHISDVWQEGLITWNLSITFYFDKGGSLICYCIDGSGDGW